MKAKFGILTIGFILVATCGAQAQTIFFTSFSASEGYVEGPITDQPAGASNVWTDGVEAVPSTDYITVENEKMVLAQNGDGADTWTYIQFPNVSEGNITVTFEWQYFGAEDANIDVGLCISDVANIELDGNTDLTWNEQSAMCRMQEANPVIDVRDGDWAGGGSYTALVSYPYTDGKLMYMRYEIDVDFPDQYLTVYAQKEGEDEVMLAENYGFRREWFDGLNSVMIWVDGGAADVKAEIDNILIAGPEGPTGLTNWSLY